MPALITCFEHSLSSCLRYTDQAVVGWHADFTAAIIQKQMILNGLCAIDWATCGKGCTGVCCVTGKVWMTFLFMVHAQ
jgi:hypothetical protein